MSFMHRAGWLKPASINCEPSTTDGHQQTILQAKRTKIVTHQLKWPRMMNPHTILCSVFVDYLAGAMTLKHAH